LKASLLEPVDARDAIAAGRDPDRQRGQDLANQRGQHRDDGHHPQAGRGVDDGAADLPDDGAGVAGEVLRPRPRVRKEAEHEAQAFLGDDHQDR